MRGLSCFRATASAMEIYGAGLVARIGRDESASVEHVESALDPHGLDLVPALEQLGLGDP